MIDIDGHKWQLNRAGLINFWYYDEEYFDFSGGRLLLRGGNGSGKSVTMQSLIPVLLDGNKSPERLDPFGSRARKMEDYLLGEKEIVNREERTGYLLLEYKRKEIDQYITTGIGLQAKSTQNKLGFWGFIILDNRRVGKDIKLYKMEFNAEKGQEERVPLTKKELEKLIGHGGRVVDSQKEYMELVNRYIFGFETLESYEELVKLIVQLRSPKLSKDFKPTYIYEILTNALPELSNEELRPLSESIESMDQIKSQMDQLKKDYDSLQKICSIYDLYNQYIFAEKAQGFVSSYEQYKKLTYREKDLQTKLTDACLEMESIKNQNEHLKNELEVLKEEQRQLQSHDVFQIEEDKQKMESSLQDLKSKIKQKSNALEQKERSELSIQNKIDSIENQISEDENEMLDILYEMETLANEGGYSSSHEIATGQFKREYKKETSFSLWIKETQDYQKQLESGLRVLRDQSKFQERYDEASKELADVRLKLDGKQKEEQKIELAFETEKQNILEKIHSWSKENQFFVLEKEEIQTISQRVLQVYELYRMDEVKQIVSEAFDKMMNSLREKSLKLEHKIEIKRKEIDQKLKEQSEWKSKEEAEPARREDVMETRKELENLGVPYVPFFSVVEFHEHIDEAQKERIESAVAEMGLLDALIIPEEFHKESVQFNKVIHPVALNGERNLTEYLYATPIEGSPINKEVIDKVLMSIAIGENEQRREYVTDKGEYGLGIIMGHAPKNPQSVYIGKESRRKYKLSTIEFLEKDIVSLKEEEKNLHAQKESLKVEMKTLREEYEKFPTLNALSEINEKLQLIHKEINMIEGELHAKNEKTKKFSEQIREVREHLKGAVIELDLKNDEKEFEHALESMKDYLNELRSLEVLYNKYRNYHDQLEGLDESVEEVRYDVDELKGELNLLDSELNKLSMQLQRIEDHLREVAADGIQEKIAKVIERLNEIPEERIQLSKEMSSIQHDIDTLESKFARTKEDIKIVQAIYQKWRDVFEAEEELGLVGIDSETESEEILTRAEWVIEQFEMILSKWDREKVTEKLNTVYFEERGNLVEYLISQKSILEVDDLPHVDANSPYFSHIAQLKQKSRRIEFLLEYEGKRVDPYYIFNRVSEDIQLQELRLNEEDRKLFEEVIMNNLGSVIRNKIQRSESWVLRMNELMEERDTYSGLKFSIKWRPRTAEHDDELDTKELVEILRSDAKILKESDMKKMSRHFSSKIRRAKELLDENEINDKTLHQAIKQILDYRQWFTFTLYYQKGDGRKKELTNNDFLKFSGGEKAMGMYIPLFSAAYSRYSEARDDAPYIITLDEAFAGVDDTNIRDMFELVDKLGFNFIMNSQAIWGDCDTISSLSISEIVRPKNAPFVTIARYYWDGKQKHLLNEGLHDMIWDEKIDKSPSEELEKFVVSSISEDDDSLF